MKSKVFILFSLINFVTIFVAFCQEYPYDTYYYNFVRYDKNYLQFYSDSSKFEKFYNQLDSVIFLGQGQLKILQIGDSHTQSDVMTGRMRQRLQTFQPGLNAGRGFVFPYRITRTNTPFNYTCSYTGEWESCRNVEMRKMCTLGITGVVAVTYDENATLKVILRNEDYVKYHFNKIKIYHNTDSSNFSFYLKNTKIKSSIIEHKDLGYTEIQTNNYLDTLELQFYKSDSLEYKFDLHGISLETDETGIIFDAIGVNGASCQSYLNGTLLNQQLNAIAPDMVIIALGINDSHSKYFNQDYFELTYESLLKKIIDARPDVPVILVVENDNYLYRRPNPATAKVEEVIIKMAKKYGCGVWSWYQVMGGYNSSILWLKSGLMAYDKVHFSIRGYILLGDLFFNAFLRSYEYHIAKNRRKIPKNFVLKNKFELP